MSSDIGSVPYRGGMQAITDMLAGTIHLNIGTTATLISLIKDGRLRAISVWGPQRFPELPDVPTMIESGFPGPRAVLLVGAVGAGRHAGRDRRQTQCRDQYGAALGGDERRAWKSSASRR